uniref:Uncharacterized protein n=1 Tax=Octopus bimaculoides TaxID=37653 RepID=A0A0L8IGE0_OCTBM
MKSLSLTLRQTGFKKKRFEYLQSLTVNWFSFNMRDSQQYFKITLPKICKFVF